MKPSIFVFALLFSSSVASAQQNTTIQMQCRDLATTGNVLAPDETLVNGMACRAVKQDAPKQAAQAVTPASANSPSTPSAPAQPVVAAAGEAKKESVQPAVHRQCLILKRMGPADQITSHMYSFGVRGKQFQYVEGDFPSGTKFHGRLTDNDVRNIQRHNAKVVIMEPKYSADDLREAKQSCKEQ
jgi:hypothetical protein